MFPGTLRDVGTDSSIHLCENKHPVSLCNEYGLYMGGSGWPKPIVKLFDKGTEDPSSKGAYQRLPPFTVLKQTNLSTCNFAFGRFREY